MTCGFNWSRISAKHILVLLIYGALLPGICLAQRQTYVSDTARPLKPNFDALSLSPARPAAASASRFARPGTNVHFDERLGVPNFVWTAQTPPRTTSSADRQRPEEAAARTYLAAHAEL